MDAPAVAVSADGKTVAFAWMDMRSGRENRVVYWRIFRSGKGGPEQAIATGGMQSGGHPALTIDDRRVVHAVWDARGTILHRTSKSAKVEKVSSEPNATQPALAGNGSIIVVAYEAGGRAVVRRLD